MCTRNVPRLYLTLADSTYILKEEVKIRCMEKLTLPISQIATILFSLLFFIVPILLFLGKIVFIGKTCETCN